MVGRIEFNPPAIKKIYLLNRWWFSFTWVFFEFVSDRASDFGFKYVVDSRIHENDNVGARLDSCPNPE